jgi:hypothetical protein
MHTIISYQQQNNKMTYITTIQFFRHTMLTVLDTNGMYKSEGNVQSSLRINSYDKMWAGLQTFQNGKYEHGFLLTLYLFEKRLAEAQNQSGASDGQSLASQTLNKLF